MKHRKRCPGTAEAELEKARRKCEKTEAREAPDFAGGAPNYDKFEGWTPDEVLVWLNMD